MKSRRRVVLDTNVVISCVVFRSGRLSGLRDAWQRAGLQTIISHKTSSELMRVLGYAKFKLTKIQIENALAQYIPYAEIAGQDASERSFLHLPVCRDPKDQMFLELAYDAHADAVVTGDADLLTLDDPTGKHLPFRIITPQALLDQIN
jgi:uncharacterized protein